MQTIILSGLLSYVNNIELAGLTRQSFCILMMMMIMIGMTDLISVFQSPFAQTSDHTPADSTETGTPQITVVESSDLLKTTHEAGDPNGILSDSDHETTCAVYSDASRSPPSGSHHSSADECYSEQVATRHKPTYNNVYHTLPPQRHQQLRSTPKFHRANDNYYNGGRVPMQDRHFDATTLEAPRYSNRSPCRQTKRHNNHQHPNPPLPAPRHHLSTQSLRSNRDRRFRNGGYRAGGTTLPRYHDYSTYEEYDHYDDRYPLEDEEDNVVVDGDGYMEDDDYGGYREHGAAATDDDARCDMRKDRRWIRPVPRRAMSNRCVQFGVRRLFDYTFNMGSIHVSICVYLILCECMCHRHCTGRSTLAD